MQIRILACLAGGCLGIVAATALTGALGLSPRMLMVGCVLAGVILGYIVSILFDVFAMSMEASPKSEPEPVAKRNWQNEQDNGRGPMRQAARRSDRAISHN